MFIKKLDLTDFRNIPAATVRPDQNFNIFWGENAQGKTNFLEAIFLLGTLKSFRGAHNEDMIRAGTFQGFLRAEIETGGISRTLAVGLEAQSKTTLLDGKKVTRPGIYFRCLRPVLFSPEEVSHVKGAPAGRRSLVDRAIFQTDPTFLSTAQEYERTLRQRNRLLREQRPPAEIDPWTAGLVRLGALIRLERGRFLKRLLPQFRQVYGKICGNREEADLIYQEGREKIQDLQEELYQSFVKHSVSERRVATTLVGPHKDDPYFTINGLPVRQFASQGQQRSILLAFKTAQILDLEGITGEPPILLLDDLTGELDRRRQEFFFQFLLKRRGQVFMTTTDLQPLLQEGFTQARTFHIRAGALDPAKPD